MRILTVLMIAVGATSCLAAPSFAAEARSKPTRLPKYELVLTAVLGAQEAGASMIRLGTYKDEKACKDAAGGFSETIISQSGPLNRWIYGYCIPAPTP